MVEVYSSLKQNDQVKCNGLKIITKDSLQSFVPFDSIKLGLLCFYVLPQRLDQLFLFVDQVRHMTCRQETDESVDDREVSLKIKSALPF